MTKKTGIIARNDITDDLIKTKVPSQQYRDNWDKIFGKKKEDEPKSIPDDSDSKRKESFDRVNNHQCEW